MQIYKDYRFIRLVFLCLVGLALLMPEYPALAISKEAINENTPVDTLFSQWNKEQSAKPYFGVSLSNFNDPVENLQVQKAVTQYGIGNVSLSNGDEEEVKAWITVVNHLSAVHPIYTFKMDKAYHWPFSGTDFPSFLEVQCIRDDSLVYQLGLEQGRLLTDMGFDVIELNIYPDKTSVDWKKLNMYLNGLNQSGLYFSMNDQQVRFVEWIGWSKILYYQQTVPLKEKELKKSIKTLRKDMGFEGLLVERYDVERGLDQKDNDLVAGANLLLLSELSSVILENKTALSKQSQSAIKKSVKKYFASWKMVKFRPREVSPNRGVEELNYLVDTQSKTLIRDQEKLIPIAHLGDKQVFTFFGNDPLSMDARTLVDLYRKSNHFSKTLIEIPVDWILEVTPPNSLMLVDLNAFYSNDNFDEIFEKFKVLNESRQVIFFLQGEVQSLDKYKDLKTLLWSPMKSGESLFDLIQMAFGAEKIVGEMPDFLRQETSSDEIRTRVIRLKYKNLKNPEVNTGVLSKIDSVVYAAIQNQEMPGCQIMMVHQGNVVYNKSFGYLSYDSLMAVEWDNLYDMASVTKTTVTVPMVMHAVEGSIIQTDRGLGDYLEELNGSDKSQILVSKLLNHESGLKSYYPFWKKASFDSTNNTFLYKEQKKRIRQSYNYLTINWEDSVNAWISRSDFNNRINQDSTYRYLYSDLGFMLLKQMVERKTSKTIDRLTDSLVFRPLSMDFTTFNPSLKFDKSLIAPTEDDRYFRKRLLQGEVHDKNAALLGGVAGHAGLFSNANDMAKYMQMMLKYGKYGGENLFDSLTVQKFSTKLDTINRRALGWDKPSHSIHNSSQFASDESFGHSGFTGTLVWADPKYDLIYIFLSNRIHPNPQNYKLIENNTRTKIHDLMYESILFSDNSQIRDM